MSVSVCVCVNTYHMSHYSTCEVSEHTQTYNQMFLFSRDESGGSKS